MCPKDSAKKILIIDDEKDFVEMAKIRLEHEGYAIDVASDGYEGLEKVREIRPDLIILDVLMPKMSGYELCRLLKFDEDMKKIPVIILSVRNGDQDKKIGDDVGADVYIGKPYEFSYLLQKIRELVK